MVDSAPVGAGDELVSITMLVGTSLALDGAVAVVSATLDASDGEDVGVGEAVVDGSFDVVGAAADELGEFARIASASWHKLCGPSSLRKAARMFGLFLSLFSRIPSPLHASFTAFVMDARPRTQESLQAWPVKSSLEQSGIDCL